MCARFAAALRRWDREGAIELVPSQAPGVRSRFPWIPADAFSEAMQLIGPGDRWWQGAAALEELFRALPRGRWIGWLFHVPFMRPIADRLYRWVARNRSRLGCGEHCRAG